MLRLLHIEELEKLKDDPVRPHIDWMWRITDGREVFVLEDDFNGSVDAIVCVTYMDEVPTCEQDMLDHLGESIAVFYTVWSYTKGAGRDIIFATQKRIQEQRPTVKRFVTLSPLTEMAQKFHIRNGAKFLNKHFDCQNFEYS